MLSGLLVPCVFLNHFIYQQLIIRHPSATHHRTSRSASDRAGRLRPGSRRTKGQGVPCAGEVLATRRSAPALSNAVAEEGPVKPHPRLSNLRGFPGRKRTRDPIARLGPVVLVSRCLTGEYSDLTSRPSPRCRSGPQRGSQLAAPYLATTGHRSGRNAHVSYCAPMVASSQKNPYKTMPYVICLGSVRT